MGHLLNTAMSEIESTVSENQHKHQTDLQVIQNSNQDPIIVQGETLDKLPEDLYIPPHALRVFLEAFTGPLDLLLYLIKKQNIDILDVPILKITEQYTHYVELIRQMDFNLAADYLVMAAMLAEIKSRFLLPRCEEADEEEEDPRAELVKRLREYEIFKQAATNLESLPHLERDIFLVQVEAKTEPQFKPQPVVTLDNLVVAMSVVLQRSEMTIAHVIKGEPLSVRERMTIVLDKVQASRFTQFFELFTREEGRAGIVVTFMAVLELLRQSMIEAVQSSPFAPIHIKAVEENATDG